MKLVTVDLMRGLEGDSEAHGVTVPMLMENAGLAVAQEVWLLLGTVADRAVLVLVGPGNNGGDGLVAARHLHDWGAKVEVYLLKPRDAENDDVYRRIVELGVPLRTAGDDPGFAALEEGLSRAEVVVDALLGTGSASAKRPIEGDLAEILRRLAAARDKPLPLQILAVDLPTGVDGDSGAADPLCVAADVTVALGHSKVGLHTLPAAGYTGRVEVVDIGIPPALSRDLPLELMTDAWARALLPERPPAANKGTFGKVLVVAGSINYVGAASLACSAAGRVGAGLVTLACPQTIYPIMAAKLVEPTFLPLSDQEGFLTAEATHPVLQALSQGYKALLVGPGLGQSAYVRAFVRQLLPALPPEGPAGVRLRAVIIDADGLNALAGADAWWEGLSVPIIVTPHPGEMSRLTGLPVADIQADRLGIALRQAARWGATVILKGAHTIVTAPDGRARISPFANPALASGGTGDVLAGAVAGLVAQALDPFDAAALGVYLHGRAAEKVRPELGEAGLLASDLLPNLPLMIKEIGGR
jgi:NAD(P)H-hydrate epimerase